MDQFIIEGSVPLKGEVTPAGNKNAALPLLAACLLTEEPVILHNVPRSGMCSIMRNLLESLGVGDHTLEPHTWQISRARSATGRPRSGSLPQDPRFDPAGRTNDGPHPASCACPRPAGM